ncbi:MAG TPA: toll/interleukin-1 receptor domain-containing protein [Anaerolineae bacterium]|nr:toll/interleukin-1 receptor domain-containing protein [Anaerolineae bacterium]MCB0179292.1 toll/interleukin-1 receptor domain-containing protein [Anaerolineae bacterium]MCB0224742.1 toll/interleukin-1 receptor domain-containing protein [Anaerolineae bacterium]MCB9108493.1 toll/interleukin-1 receptor domain-containing protein [Anaerolineales bacterium]HRV92000.1 toll/interleukin-1 receptor domain-containing protein [Anaerolineae bacterium]
MEKQIVPKPTIFISYSRKDEAEKEQLLAHLSVLQHAGLTHVWSDDQIGAGHDWQQEIQDVVNQARIAIFLVSANFLTSEFILGQEVPALLHRRQIEGLIVVPIIAKACAWRKVAWLSQLQVRPTDGRPIWHDGGRHADDDLAHIAEEVADMLEFVSPLSELLPQYPFTLPNRKPSLRDFRQWLQGTRS